MPRFRRRAAYRRRQAGFCEIKEEIRRFHAMIRGLREYTLKASYPPWLRVDISLEPLSSYRRRPVGGLGVVVRVTAPASGGRFLNLEAIYSTRELHREADCGALVIWYRLRDCIHKMLVYVRDRGLCAYVLAKFHQVPVEYLKQDCTEAELREQAVDRYLLTPQLPDIPGPMLRSVHTS